MERKPNKVTKYSVPVIFNFVVSDEDKSAFEAVLNQTVGENKRYSDALWRRQVESVIVGADRKLEFHFKSGEIISYQT